MNDNRRKLTGILKLLYENTDSGHSMSTYQIMDSLEAMGYGRIDRKTVEANIKYLMDDMSFGITKVKGKPNRYHWSDREFDISELKLIADSIQSSRFVPARKAREITAKLKDLTSVYQAESLNRDVHSGKLHKADGTAALPKIDTINEAIRTSRRIRFTPIDYDMNKREFEPLAGGSVTVSPYALLLNKDHYYMLALPEVRDEVVSYRVGHMKDVVMTDEPAAPAPADFSISGYTSHVFNMLDGELAEVTLVCKSHVMKDLLDRFGTGFRSEPLSEETFRATVVTDTSKDFFSWVFGYCGVIRITSPASACAQFEEMLKRNM